MKAPATPTRLFLDSGDPAESQQALDILGRLDGQTTNPSLIAKNPALQTRLRAGRKLSESEALEFYRQTLLQIEKLTPGPISVEVYADESSTASGLLAQGRKLFRWVNNAYVKFPTTRAGLEAAERAVAEGIRVNLTLCFSQAQAAAVYAATQGTQEPAFVSPFVGRLDDRGENGMQLIENILRMYNAGDGHVLVLTASVRNVKHLLYAFALGSPLVTAPLSVFRDWASGGFAMPQADFRYDPGSLRALPYQDVQLDRPWNGYDLRHELTDVGQRRFAEAWNSLLSEARVAGS
jgi:transaldolase